MHKTVSCAMALLLAGCMLSCSKSNNQEDEYFIARGVVVDWDSRLPVPAVKVKTWVPTIYPGNPLSGDSTLTDNNGVYTLRIKKERLNTNWRLFAFKSSDYFYMNNPWFSVGIMDKFDTLYLARKSYVNVTLHKSSTYLPDDSIRILVSGDYDEDYGFNSVYKIIAHRKANAPDTVINLSTIYNTPYNNTKLFFRKEFYRGGIAVSILGDSTDIVQFAIKNFTLNY